MRKVSRNTEPGRAQHILTNDFRQHERKEIKKQDVEVLAILALSVKKQTQRTSKNVKLRLRKPAKRQKPNAFAEEFVEQNKHDKG